MSCNAITKAMDAALNAAEQRQRWGARELERLVPADGVLLSCRVSRTSNVLAQLVWPGILRELDSSTGEVLADTPVALMFELRPQLAALLMARAKSQPVLRTEFWSPQGSKLITYMDAAGVVYVRSARTKELLAVSEPGEPFRLRAGFQPLKPEDLRPSLR